MLERRERLKLEDGRELRLLSALEVLEARREAEGLARGEAEAALCANACLLARALERGGQPVFADGGAALAGLSAREIGALAGRWAAFDRAENPSPEDGEERLEGLKKSLEHAPYERLRWRVLQRFGALPTEERAKQMKARDYLWCALHLALDREEELARLCPACRSEAAEERCPACGALRTETAAGQNAAFDEARFERLKRGESG